MGAMGGQYAFSFRHSRFVVQHYRSVSSTFTLRSLTPGITETLFKALNSSGHNRIQNGMLVTDIQPFGGLSVREIRLAPFLMTDSRFQNVIYPFQI